MTGGSAKRKERQRLPRAAVGLACLILSILASVPFFFIARPGFAPDRELGIPVTHDMHLHFEQMKSFYNGLSAGAIYPRWEEDTNRHFGAPTTIYYPPAIYYLTSASFAVFRDWWMALLGVHVLLMIASAAAIYVYVRKFSPRIVATVAMAVYIFVPYHLLDQYQRGAMAELLGFIWMPLIMLFGERLLEVDQQAGGDARPPGTGGTAEQVLGGAGLLYRGIAGLGLSYGAFLWSHPPTAFQFTLSFAVFTIVMASARKQWKGALRVVLGLALGLALSAAYLLPAAVEKDLIRHNYVSETWPYHSTYILLHDLKYSGGHRGFFFLLDVIWMLGTAVIAGAVIVWLVLATIRSASARRLGAGFRRIDWRVAGWVVMGSFASFMMLEASAPLGRLIPNIEIGVFTWRMLSINNLVVALIAGAATHGAVNAFRKRRWLRGGGYLLATLTILGGVVVFSVLTVIGPMYQAPAMLRSVEHINLAMIPRTAPKDPLTLPYVDRVSIVKGSGTVKIEVWAPEYRKARVELAEPSELSIRIFNFPCWTASVNGEAIPVMTDPRLGNIVIELPAGSHDLALRFNHTMSRRLGGYTTVFAFGLALLILLAGLRKRRTPIRNSRESDEISTDLRSE